MEIFNLPYLLSAGLVTNEFVSEDYFIFVKKDHTADSGYRNWAIKATDVIGSLTPPTPVLNYKVYTVSLTQTTGGNPVVIPLDNTFGIIPVPTITRINQGHFRLTAVGMFVNEDKISVIPGLLSFLTGGLPLITNSYGVMSGYKNDDDTYDIFTINPITNTAEDNLLYKTTLEIKVYN